MVTYEELLQRQLIKNYFFDLNSCIQLTEQGNAKYAVIAGYYAVLNVTLWYFAKYFNLKISEEDTGVHTNSLIVLEKFVKEERLRQRIIKLLEEHFLKQRSSPIFLLWRN